MTNALRVPLQYHVEEGVNNPKMISIKCTDADGNKNKEEVPIFGNNEPDELLLNSLGDNLVLNERYSWMDNEKGKLLFQHFGRAMKGKPLRKWSKLTNNQHAFTLQAFNDTFSDLIDDLFGEDTYDDQLEYLCDENMPTSLKSSEWIDRIEVIENSENFLDDDESYKSAATIGQLF